MKETTQEWIKYAKADLLNCELILNEAVLTNIIAFHAQQAVEKAFKALMQKKRKLCYFKVVYMLFQN